MSADVTAKNGEVIKVFVRVRPPISQEVQHDTCIKTPSKSSVHLRSEKHDLQCAYDRVFGELDGQEEIFEDIKPLLADVLGGYNACIFAYGQTSAGKTHTMLGPKGGQDIDVDRSQWGVLPRAAEFLFSELQGRVHDGEFTFTAKASFFQIYNEKLADLLSPQISGDDNGLRIREIPRMASHKSSQHPNQIPCEVFIAGLSEFRVQTTDDILRILAVGSAARATRSTNFNATSSRSHAILQIGFEMESVESNGQKMIFRSKLSLVDLAGSEKMQAIDESSLRAADHLKELTSINQSLSSLGNVIAALASKHRTHIPYRDSKLTRILQDSLGGNTRTILISCVAPTVIHSAESVSTLQFADRAKSVMVKAKANLVIDDKILLTNAQSEIARLKLLLKQALLKLEHASAVGGDASVSMRLEDGETNEEMDRVLKENKRLRKENAVLTRELKDIRNGRLWGRSKGVGTGGAPRSSKSKRDKPEWASSMVDDEVYRKPRRKGRDQHGGVSGVRESRTSPANSIPEGVLYGGGSNVSGCSPRDETGGLPVVSPGRIKPQQQKSAQLSTQSKKYRIRDALGQELGPGVALGSPSKSSIAAVRRIYFGANGSEAAERTEYACDEEEDDALDVSKLRQKLQRAQDSKQLQELEKKLNGASNLVKTQLQEEEEELRRIQSSREELERQLRELQQVADEEEEGSPTLQPVQPREVSPTKSKSFSPAKITATATPQSKPVNSSSGASVNVIGLSSADIQSGEIKDEVTNQHPPANLCYSKEDVGRTIEMYVFRYNTWELLQLLDFEPTKKLHKCRHVDKSEKWLDLKKKPIRSQKNNY